MSVQGRVLDKMEYSILFLVLIFGTACSEKVSVCFYTNWAQYRQGIAKFLPSDIDVELCSHIYYAFAQINMQTLQIENYEWNDDVMISEVNALKKQKPSLKTVISVGGWNHDLYQHRYSKMVTNATTRKIFIDSAIAHLKKHDFDGISYDWEWPGNRGSPPADKHKFTLLLQETYDAFQNEAKQSNQTPYLLTASVGAGPKVIATAYEIPEIAEYVDWVNIMTYDLHGSWENVTGCSTAVSGPLPTVPDSLKIFLEGGMPAQKTLVGLAAYGRSFQLALAENAGLGAPVNGPGLAGKYTREQGSLSFYEICSTKWSQVTTWNVSKAGAPYASESNQWIGYDTPSSIRHKVTSLINRYDLRGFGFWALDLDDFTGTFCNMGKYPLLTAAVESMDRSNENIRFEKSKQCFAATQWRHFESLNKWCGKNCVVDGSDCPYFMCDCFSQYLIP